MDPERFKLLVEQIAELGLTGEEKLAFIEKAQEREDKIKQKQLELAAKEKKDERDLAAKREKEERDLAAKRENREAEEARREAEFRAQEKKEERDREIREAELKAQRELKEMETRVELDKIELEKIRLTKPGVTKQERENGEDSSHFTHKGARYPKMPYFNESQDDMDSYLFRFETFAKNSKWDPSDWPMFLSVHLQGTSLSLYHSLCATGPIEYEHLKKALLTKFLCTKDGYRDKFRACKPETDESFFSFSTRFTHLFDRWISMTEIDKSYEGLRDLMFCEHILSSVSKDLSVFERA